MVSSSRSRTPLIAHSSSSTISSISRFISRHSMSSSASCCNSKSLVFLSFFIAFLLIGFFGTNVFIRNNGSRNALRLNSNQQPENNNESRTENDRNNADSARSDVDGAIELQLHAGLSSLLFSRPALADSTKNSNFSIISSDSQISFRDEEILLPNKFSSNGNSPPAENVDYSLLRYSSLNFPFSIPFEFTIASPGKIFHSDIQITKSGIIKYSYRNKKNEESKEEMIFSNIELVLSVNGVACNIPMNSTGSGVLSGIEFSSGYSRIVNEIDKNSTGWSKISNFAQDSAVSDAEFRELTIFFETENCAAVIVFRLFDSAIASRALIKPIAADSKEEKSRAPVDWGIRIPLAADSWDCLGSNYEEPIRRGSCDSLLQPLMTPVLMNYQLKNREFPFVALLQADGPGFMRSRANRIKSESKSNSFELLLNSRGEALINPKSAAEEFGLRFHRYFNSYLTPTPWHLIIAGRKLIDLPPLSRLVPLLCPPPSSEFRELALKTPFRYGKSLRVKTFSDSASMELAKFASENSFQLIHFDAGWYGDEYNITSSARLVDPKYSDSLHFPVVTEFARGLGIGVSIYVNELALRDTEILKSLYSRDWQLNGIKFGFVDVESPRAMRILHERIIKFGSMNLFVNVHDAYRPIGLSRSLPFLLAQEGIRGEERKPSADHHVLLPFIRFLQGPADYTPRYFSGAGVSCSPIHQLALPIVLFSPLQSLYWAEPLAAIRQANEKYSPELKVWREFNPLPIKTLFIDSELGKYVILARRSVCSSICWFIAVLNSETPRDVQFTLEAIMSEDERNNQNKIDYYSLEIFEDGEFTNEITLPIQLKPKSMKKYYILGKSHTIRPNNIDYPQYSGNLLKFHLHGSGGVVIKMKSESSSH